MKKWIALIVLCFAATAFAAVTVTLTIPDASAARVLAMMRQWDHCHIHIVVQGSENAGDPNVPDYHAEWDITDAIPPEDPNTETPQQFGKRFIRQLLVGCVKAHEMVAAKATEKAAHDAIAPADVNVPDGIIQ